MGDAFAKEDIVEAIDGRRERELITAASAAYLNWWWSAPALLKGYIDRVFLPGFAMRYHERFPYVEPLLRGRSARVIYTQNSPRLAGVLFRGDLFWQWIKRAVLHHCGFAPVRRMVLYNARHAPDNDRNRFLDKVRELGRLGR
jgi:putative NADPH-quinone reductase